MFHVLMPPLVRRDRWHSCVGRYPWPLRLDAKRVSPDDRSPSDLVVRRLTRASLAAAPIGSVVNLRKPMLIADPREVPPRRLWCREVRALRTWSDSTVRRLAARV